MSNQTRKYLVAGAIPVTFSVGLILFFWDRLRGLSAQDIISFLPTSVTAAAGLMLLLFAAKSLSVFFPIAVLNMACGLLFELPVAFCVNLAGSFIVLTLPYWVGRWTGGDWEEAVLNRFPKLRGINRFRGENPILFGYLVRAMDCLPGDLVSWYLGSTGMRYGIYIGGALLGNLPNILMTTLFGASLAQGLTWKLFFTGAAMILTGFVLSYLTNQYVKSRNRGAPESGGPASTHK